MTPLVRNAPTPLTTGGEASGPAHVLGRLSLYLGEMFPLPRRLLTAALLAVSFGVCLARAHALPIQRPSGHTLVAIWGVFGLMLILRLMDELKDEKTDRQLFPERPLPSGRVRRSDVTGLLVLAAVAYVPLHAGAGPALLTALLLLAYAFLMFRWFFFPEWLRPRLLPTLATHTPIIPLLLLHLVVVFAAERRLPLAALRWEACCSLVVLFWSPVLGWEIARKIRAPREENAYVTYSRIFGARGAVLFAVAAQTLALIAGAHSYWSHGFSAAFLATIVAGYAVVLWAHRRFLARPSPRTARLGPVAELNVVCVLAAGLLA